MHMLYMWTSKMLDCTTIQCQSLRPIYHQFYTFCLKLQNKRNANNSSIETGQTACPTFSRERRRRRRLQQLFASLQSERQFLLHTCVCPSCKQSPLAHLFVSLSMHILLLGRLVDVGAHAAHVCLHARICICAHMASFCAAHSTRRLQ